MRSGTCPGCGGTEVYASRNALSIGGGSETSVEAHIEPGFRGMRPRYRTKELWQLACASCGKVEIYLMDPGALEFIRSNWVRIDATS
jgi:hypothetical protein